MSTDTNALRERIVAALLRATDDGADRTEEYAAAVLPIIEAEVCKAKAEALREAAALVLAHPPIDRYGRVMTGARAAAKKIDRLADEYETGDSDEHR